MALPRHRAPWWFLWLVAVGMALAYRLVQGCVNDGGSSGGHQPQVQLAFWGFIILVAELIWKGVEVAGKITLEILHWLYLQLSLIVTHIGNGLKTVGSALLAGLKKSWEFLRLTYDKVLKPAWDKFWRWFDRFRKWLDDTFGPVLRWLRRVRDTLLDFWKRYVRPWLDLIDVTRRLLRVLNALGLHWAAALDAKLGAIEDAIERPFRLLLAKVNEIITLVDRVITFDGLLQRVALIRSLARDYNYAWRAIANPYRKPIPESARHVPEISMVYDPPDVLPEVRAFLRDGTGADAAIVHAEAAAWRQYVRPA
jgi:hypothetical protein